MPPALSVIGPNASSATIMPVIDSMPSRRSRCRRGRASSYAPQIAAQTASTGSAVDFIDTPRPAMMFVAWPVVDDAATFFTGLKFVPV